MKGYKLIFFLTLFLVPEPDNFTVITDSTSYTATLPLNEVTSAGVSIQEFTIYLSPNELSGKYPVNTFLLILEEPSGNLASFVLENKNFELLQNSDTVQTVPNALLTASDSNLEVGIYNITLSVQPFGSAPFDLVNFVVTIVEG